MATHSSILAWTIPMDREAWWVAVCGVTTEGLITASTRGVQGVDALGRGGDNSVRVMVPVPGIRKLGRGAGLEEK